MILESLGAFGGLIVAVGAAFGFFFFGGKKWREVAEALQASLSLTKGELLGEKTINADLRDTIEGMSARLARLDEERQEFVGSKAYDAILAQSDDRKLNETLADLAAFLQRGDDC